MAEGGVGGDEETGGCGERRGALPPPASLQFAALAPSAAAAAGHHLRDDRDIASQPSRRPETVQSYESDCESSSSSGSPEPPQPLSTMGGDGGTDLSIGPPKHRIEENNISSDPRLSPGMHAGTGAAAVAASTHLNGTMAGLVSLHQNLQNLASLQQSLPQVASLAAGLTNMATLTSAANSVVNTPLNLSVSASVATSRGACATPVTGEPPPNPLQTGAVGPPTPGPPPQAPPTLLGAPPPPQPAPMPQLILAAGQLVQGIQGAQLLIPTSQGLATQTILTIPVNHVNSSDQMVNLALNNGQVMQTSLANLQAMAQSNLLSSPTNTPVSAPNGTIAAPPPPPPPLINPAALTHLLSNSSAQQLLQTLPQMLNAPPPAPLLNPLAQPLLGAPQPPLLASPQPQAGAGSASQRGGYAEPKLRPLSRNPSPPAAAAANRMASNGDAAAAGNQPKRSPELSPSCGDGGSTADLLIDSPNQPTINQTSSNVVDGINLDEIKDFAKAFKLRRLSLGLTQTQVGQALSVTEGPAYSQSAICSALASQMVAAAAQQQAMFEKLDITPKSAQKIKPVLERWMKEAEESFSNSRYKSGQNHLTDFIGIEPSKKRKRRTSFTPQALELLNAHFERNTHPSGTEITGLAHQLGYEREVIRIWFCNKRQALKNTVRMMSKGMV